MSETNKLSSYRVTDLPQLTDLNNQDLFLITHSKDTGGYESQSIPFNRLMRAVKRRGFKEEIQVINDLNINAARKSELEAEATTRAQSDATISAVSKQYTDSEIQKLHTHANLNVLSTITNKNISQWNNDVGYLSSHQSLEDYAEKVWVLGLGYLSSHQSLSAYATKTQLSDDISAAEIIMKQYTDDEISKLHIHDNLAILSTITDKNISQWNNDAGYLSSHREYSEISAGIHLSDYELTENLKSAAYQEKEYFAISSHDHDTRYYTKDETEQKISSFVNRSEFGSAAFTEQSDYLAEKDFKLKYTTGSDILQLSVGQTVLSAKIETSGGESGTTYEYVHGALSNDGYALKTRIRIWED